MSKPVNSEWLQERVTWLQRRAIDLEAEVERLRSSQETVACGKDEHGNRCGTIYLLRFDGSREKYEFVSVGSYRQAKEALRRVVEAAESQWVRVEDGMPKHGHTVVVILDGEKLAAIWSGEKWFMPCFRGSDWLPEKAMTGITHWMPLPALKPDADRGGEE